MTYLVLPIHTFNDLSTIVIFIPLMTYLVLSIHTFIMTYLALHIHTFNNLSRLPIHAFNQMTYLVFNDLSSH